MATTSPETPRLIADIGGTNARFALVQGDGIPYAERTLFCAEYPKLANAITAYLQTLAEPRPSEAALAVAMPVGGDQVTFTNNPQWSFSVEDLRQTLGFERLLLLNDFTALALALPCLGTQEIRSIGGGTAVAEAVIGLLGPGTGLGVSGLVWSGERWIPLQSEGGHVSFAPVTEREWQIVRLVAARFGHVSAERLLSGPGLVNIYQAVAALEGKTPETLEPSQITEAGLTRSCPLCVETLEFFCAALGTVAGNLAITLGARGGIYIGGGIVPQLGVFFEQSGFRPRFEAMGRFESYMAAIPTHVITAVNPALRGIAMAF